MIMWAPAASCRVCCCQLPGLLPVLMCLPRMPCPNTLPSLSELQQTSPLLMPGPSASHNGESKVVVGLSVSPANSLACLACAALHPAKQYA